MQHLNKLFLVVSLCGALVGMTSDVLANTQTEKIAAVEAGTLKTANASWWGFQAEDATETLQRAIDSKVPRLVIDNTGSDWIINKPLKLVSNQEIVFEEGVVLQAKKGAFLGTNDSLLLGQNVENVSLIGKNGATLRMQRDDYANPQLYKKAEWRHGISFIDSKNIVLRGLTVKESGGDGLYLGASVSGYNKNVLVEDMVFDSNYRLGMAVISAEDLIIRRSQFNNTKGTAPNGGLDFEPNYPTQRLVNCVVEDSSFTGNLSGPGIELYFIQLNSTSLPVSLEIHRAQASGNALAVKSTVANKLGNAVKGDVKFFDSRFDHNRLLLYTPSDAVQHTFTNCVFDYGQASQKIKAAWDNVPIVLAADAQAKGVKLGNVTFENSTAILEKGGEPLRVGMQGEFSLADNIGGSLFVEHNNAKKAYDVGAFVKERQAYLESIRALKPATVELENVAVPAADVPRPGNDEFFLQGAFTFLQYAETGQQITINARVRKVYDREPQLELQDPEGKVIQTYKIPVTYTVFPIQFTATQTGFYRVVRKELMSQYVDISSAHRGSALLVDGKLNFLPKKGQLYFQVSAGVKEFKIGVTTDSAADVALLDANQKVVERQEHVNGLQIFSATRKDVSKSEIWSLRVESAVWLVTVTPYKPLVPLFSTNSRTLLQSK